MKLPGLYLKRNIVTDWRELRQIISKIWAGYLNELSGKLNKEERQKMERKLKVCTIRQQGSVHL
jgi:hypothetical protein